MKGSRRSDVLSFRWTDRTETQFTGGITGETHFIFPLSQQNGLSALLECLPSRPPATCMCSEVTGAAPEPRRSQKVWDDWGGQVRRCLDSVPINKRVAVRQLQLLKPSEGRRVSLQRVESDRVRTRRWQSIKARKKTTK